MDETTVQSMLDQTKRLGDEIEIWGYHASLLARNAREALTEVQRLQTENAQLRAACEAAFDWFDRFGKDAPIVFGGEAELSEQLRAALTAAHRDIAK